MNLFDCVIVFLGLFFLFSFLRNARQAAEERRIKRIWEEQRAIYDRFFAELGITPPALANSGRHSPKPKKGFSIGWIIFGIFAGVWFALLLRPWLAFMVAVGPKEFFRLLGN